eukprot:765942-Hanusia_phi.AAC.1
MIRGAFLPWFAGLVLFCHAALLPVRAHESYSLSILGQNVCAGSTLYVHYSAPAGHALNNIIVMYLGTDSQNFVFSWSKMVPSNTSGMFAVETYESYAGQLVTFRYFQNSSSTSSPLAATEVVNLGNPSDPCGVCGGNGSTCVGCDGVINSGKQIDKCGVCAGNNQCLDCSGVPYGAYRIDRCGRCGEPKYTCSQGPRKGFPCQNAGECGDGPCTTDLPWESWNLCVDCAGTLNGTLVRDSCGVCGGSDGTCLPGYIIFPPLYDVCADSPLLVDWVAPADRARTSILGYGSVTADGSAGPLQGWGYMDPTQAGSSSSYLFQALQSSGTLLGSSMLLGNHTDTSGSVLFNRSSASQQVSNCVPGGSEQSPRCLSSLEYFRPMQPGRYRMQVFSSSMNPQRIAQSAVFQVLQRPDDCGVCGGDGTSCRGCDGMINSGVVFDRCGVCGGQNACLGCDGIPFSGKIVDICGVCAGLNASCTGCDGIARPDGGMKYDSCGNCGGEDDSCALPPKVGLLPYPADFACGSTLSFWWTAPSNRSSSDFIAVCFGGTPLQYAPGACLPILLNISGRYGEATVEMQSLQPDTYDIRYMQHQPLTSDGNYIPFVVKFSLPFVLKSPSDSSCISLEARVNTQRQVYCPSEEIVVDWSLPPQLANQYLESAVLGITGEMSEGLPCTLACYDAAVGCSTCCDRICGIGQTCTNSGTFVVPVTQSVQSYGLSTPPEAGRYRVCLYDEYSLFVENSPLACSAPFWISSKGLDVCGVCAGDGKSCLGCDGIPFSGNVKDVCGVCGGNGKSCLGCDGVPNSKKVVDACGVCGGNGRSCLGCDGIPYSDKTFDSCGICGGQDFHCNDPYQLFVQGSCHGGAVLVSWRAPSNHPALSLKLNTTRFPCLLHWYGLDGPDPQPLPEGSLASLKLSEDFAAGYPGCGEPCTMGWAIFLANSDYLNRCAEQSLRWNIYLEAEQTKASSNVMQMVQRAEIRQVQFCGSCEVWYGQRCSVTTTAVPTTTTSRPSTTTPRPVTTSSPVTTPPPSSSMVETTPTIETTPAANLTTVKGFLLIHVAAAYVKTHVEQFASAIRGAVESFFAADTSFYLPSLQASVDAVCNEAGTSCDWFNHPGVRWSDAPSKTARRSILQVLVFS